MSILKKIINKIKQLFDSPEPQPLLKFFTKDIFKGKKYKIGDYTYGKPNVLFENEDANLIIGKFCSIADDVTIFLGGNHRTDWITTYPFNRLKKYFPNNFNIKGHPATKGDVIIGNDVWIGSKVIIMSGVSIGNGAVVAAGTVVSKNIGAYEIWGGNPSKLLKLRFEAKMINELQDLAWWDWDIIEIRKGIPFLCSNNLKQLKAIKDKKYYVK